MYQVNQNQPICLLNMNYFHLSQMSCLIVPALLSSPVPVRTSVWLGWSAPGCCTPCTCRAPPTCRAAEDPAQYSASLGRSHPDPGRDTPWIITSLFLVHGLLNNCMTMVRLMVIIWYLLTLSDWIKTSSATLRPHLLAYQGCLSMSDFCKKKNNNWSVLCWNLVTVVARTELRNGLTSSMSCNPFATIKLRSACPKVAEKQVTFLLSAPTVKGGFWALT